MAHIKDYIKSYEARVKLLKRINSTKFLEASLIDMALYAYNEIHDEKQKAKVIEMAKLFANMDITSLQTGKNKRKDAILSVITKLAKEIDLHVRSS